jgi:predicted nucleic acid-binding protein
MGRYALDASTVLAYVLAEEHTDLAAKFIDSIDAASDRLIGPALLMVECTAVIRTKIFEGKLTEAQASESLHLALSLPIEAVVDQDQHPLALRFSASRRARKAYDDHYLAVAMLARAELVTIDGGMYQGAVNFNIPARLLR